MPRHRHVSLTGDVIASKLESAHILNRFVNFVETFLNAYNFINFRSLRLRLGLVDSLDCPLLDTVLVCLVQALFGCDFYCSSFTQFVGKVLDTRDSTRFSWVLFYIDLTIGSDPLLLIKKCTAYHTSISLGKPVKGAQLAIVYLLFKRSD